MEENNDTNHNNVAPVVVQKKRSKKLLKVILIILTAVLVLGIGGAGAWLWQQQKIDDAAANNSALNADKTALQDKVTAHELTITQLQAKVATLEQQANPESVELDLTVGDAIHNGAAYNQAGTDLLYVDITVKNTNSADGYFSTYNLKLKDAANKVHPLCENSAIGYYVCKSGLDDLPQGKTELKSQEVMAGDTITGTVGFYVPNNLDSFTLTYDGQDYQITAQ